MLSRLTLTIHDDALKLNRNSLVKPPDSIPETLRSTELDYFSYFESSPEVVKFRDSQRNRIGNVLTSYDVYDDWSKESSLLSLTGGRKRLNAKDVTILHTNPELGLSFCREAARMLWEI